MGDAMPQGRPTQADVARAAGVSQTTVSIVLNKTTGGTVRLAEETRQRVLDALEETGYIVNPIARSLAGHRTGILGVFGFEPVFGSNSESFYLPFMEGIEQAAETAARDLLLFASAARDGSRHHIYRQNENRLRLVDACILIGNGEPQVELSRLAAEGYPFVFIGRREVPGFEVPYVTADYYEATKAVVTRLHGLGHVDIVYLAASRGLPKTVRRRDTVQESIDERRALPSSYERLMAMQDALAEFEIVGHTVFDDDPGYRDKVRAALASGATAIVAEPLVDIEEIVDDLEAQGISIPEDVSIAILGDPLGTSRSEKFWSGYRMPRQEMGRSAVEMLLEMLDSPQTATRQKTIACMPEKGRSVGPRKQQAQAPNGNPE